MNYDLTSLLITISAASASFSAILGGIIGSKLLSINGDRDINSQKIDDLTEELILKVERRDRFEYQINENISLEFFSLFLCFSFCNYLLFLLEEFLPKIINTSSFLRIYFARTQAKTLGTRNSP